MVNKGMSDELYRYYYSKDYVNERIGTGEAWVGGGRIWWMGRSRSRSGVKRKFPINVKMY